MCLLVAPLQVFGGEECTGSMGVLMRLRHSCSDGPYATASRGLHSLFSALGGHQECFATTGNSHSTLPPPYRRIVAAGIGNWCGWSLRELLGFGNAPPMYPSYTIVRHMGLKKTKEQPRGSLWRSRSVISRETVLAVHELKRNRDNPNDLTKIFQTRIARLLKTDLLAVLSELQRQNQIFLALKVFDFVRKESWYKPDQFFYRSMMDALGRNRLIPDIERKFQELQDEGIKPEVPIYRELVGAYVRVGMMPEALEVHKKMVENGCGKDELSLKFLEMGRTKEAYKLRQQLKAEAKLKAEELKTEAQTVEESNEEIPN